MYRIYSLNSLKNSSKLTWSVFPQPLDTNLQLSARGSWRVETKIFLGRIFAKNFTEFFCFYENCSRKSTKMKKIFAKFKTQHQPLSWREELVERHFQAALPHSSSWLKTTTGRVKAMAALLPVTNRARYGMPMVSLQTQRCEILHRFACSTSSKFYLQNVKIM